MKYGLFLLMKMRGRVVILWMRVGLSYYVLIFYKKKIDKLGIGLVDFKYYISDSFIRSAFSATISWSMQP
jgi:hypothetical protein